MENEVLILQQKLKESDIKLHETKNKLMNTESECDNLRSELDSQNKEKSKSFYHLIILLLKSYKLFNIKGFFDTNCSEANLVAIATCILKNIKPSSTENPNLNLDIESKMVILKLIQVSLNLVLTFERFQYHQTTPI